ncbi:MAG: hypothetical protein QXH80_04730 [Candidatus Nanoarchaeia archaeon]
MLKSVGELIKVVTPENFPFVLCMVLVVSNTWIGLVQARALKENTKAVISALAKLDIIAEFVMKALKR